MHFAYPLPVWLAIILAAAIAGLVYVEYRRPLSPLSRAQRGVLVALRAVMLVPLLTFLFRPLALLPPASARDAIVPVLVDVSRSMRLTDADGQTRLARAAAMLKGDFGTALKDTATTEIYTVGETIAPGAIDA